jgi:hypothetical protein
MSQKTSPEPPLIPYESLVHLPNEDRLEQWEGEGGAMQFLDPKASAPGRGATARVEEA